VRLSALLVFATVVVACGTTQGAAPLASGEPPSPVTASSIPSPVQPIVLSGKNSKVTNPIELPAGNYRVSWSAKYGHHGYGSIDNFSVYITGQSKDLLINEIIPTTPSGEVLFTSLGGQFILSIESSDSTWKITFTWLSP